jgi:hypothetical protein
VTGAFTSTALRGAHTGGDARMTSGQKLARTAFPRRFGYDVEGGKKAGLEPTGAAAAS